MRRVIAALLAVCLCAALSLTPVRADDTGRFTPSGIAYDDIAGRMDSYVEEYKAGLASCSAAVFDRNGILTVGRYGYTDLENGVAADENAVYEWGSTSKLLVWVSLMQLYERGLVDFETDIRTYLPDGFLTKLQYPEQRITILNLMNHNAGFQESAYENQQATEDELFVSLEEAVRVCECYQAYHVGEHTAYSNWGTALAAYIVECVSGVDYVTYVQENIFAPLGMTHTSIDMHMADNPWVREQRSKMRCYGRYMDAENNLDYGVYYTWVQLFPAGAAIGTIDDLARFGQGFVARDCPFFARGETRDLMLSASSYYGHTDIARNCHGLWTMQCRVQTLGHGGNTGGMTANLQFDPVGGLGIAVLTNEPGETMFCTGLATLLFGEMTDSELVKANPVTEHTDATGVYQMARTIERGFASASKYAGGFFWTSATDDADVYDMPMTGGMQLRHIGDGLWLQSSPSGMRMLCFEVRDANGRFTLETETTDFVRMSPLGPLVYLGFVLFGIGCMATLLIKLAARAARRYRGRVRVSTAAERRITLQQAVYGVSGVILFLLIAVIGPLGYGFAVVSCVLAGMLGLFSLVNAVLLARDTLRDRPRARTLVKQVLWTDLCVFYAAVIVWFQLYDFVHI